MTTLHEPTAVEREKIEDALVAYYHVEMPAALNDFDRKMIVNDMGDHWEVSFEGRKGKFGGSPFFRVEKNTYQVTFLFAEQ